MRMKTQRGIATFLSLLVLVSLQESLFAQSGCARCASPNSRQIRNSTPGGNSEISAGYRQIQPRYEEAPPSPYYTPEDEPPAAGRPGRARTNRDLGPTLVPTDSADEPIGGGTTGKPKSKGKTPEIRPELAERIGRRYSDPRVVRMLAQLTPSGIESLYAEVSNLIDGRHISPSVYSRRVDDALEHLSQALDVPSFVEAAGIRATPEALSGLKDELQEFRSALWVRNTGDAVAGLHHTTDLFTGGRRGVRAHGLRDRVADFLRDRKSVV